jgi:hypothetical protein
MKMCPPTAADETPTTTLREPARPFVVDDVDTPTHPLFPDTELPVATLTLPDTPMLLTAAVVMTTEPEPKLTLDPVSTKMLPPTPFAADNPPRIDTLPPADTLLRESPPRTTTSPPDVELLATTTLTEPARPPVDCPALNNNDPVPPEAAVPDESTITPLSPDELAGAVAIDTIPVEEDALSPPLILISPPPKPIRDV